MSIEKFVEDQISKAIAEGAFDNLPGRGKPIDLSSYFKTPEELRLCYSILRNANFLPEEVELLREIESLKVELRSRTDNAETRALVKLINEKTLIFRSLIERRSRK